MRQLRVKIGESTLVVNEKGQLCELVNFPVHLFRGRVLEISETEKVEQPVIGMIGKFGNIHFLGKKL